MAKPKTLTERAADRRRRMDEESGYGPTKKAPKPKAKSRKYEDDFNDSVEIDELKKKKAELLKGISGKSEAQKKKIREELKKLNDEIMKLEESSS